jgi:ABC-type dipeptide/oligopeptide/nickel transport system ATPase component
MGESEILRVEDLHTSFFLPIGELQAVRGVSFSLQRGRSLGIVGESGSGKTVLARSIMRLNLGSNVETRGSAFFDGRDLLALPLREMRRLWGAEIAMIFQDPMTSLNPTSSHRAPEATRERQPSGSEADRSRPSQRGPDSRS